VTDRSISSTDRSKIANGSRRVERARLPTERLEMARAVEPESLVVPSARELRVLFDASVEGSNKLKDLAGSRLDSAYEKCREVTSEYSKTFFLGSQLLGHHEQRAVWAIYNWCRVTDELVDGPAAETTTMTDLDAWSQRVEALFQLSRSTLPDEDLDWEDLSLSDSIRRFNLIERPFQDMVAGMAMDLVKTRYQTFDELQVYCYRVAGTVGLMTLPILGLHSSLNPTEELRQQTVSAGMSLGMAFQLTNILRDVGEDARRGRIYVPMEDLHRFGISEQEVLEASNTNNLLYNEDRWREFMEFQMSRCQKYYEDAESGIAGLSPDNRLGVVSALKVYGAILDAVRTNSYDNLSQRAFVPNHEKALLVGHAWWRTQELGWAAASRIPQA